jgi:hypothetical protein
MSRSRSSQSGCRGPAGGRASPRWRRGGARAGLCHEVELGLDLRQVHRRFRPAAGMDIARGRVRPSAERQGHVRPATRREAGGMAGSSAIAMRSIMAATSGSERPGPVISSGPTWPLAIRAASAKRREYCACDVVSGRPGKARRPRRRCGPPPARYRLLPVHGRPSDRPWHPARHGPSGRSGRA